MANFITPREAAQLIEPGWTITTGGFGSCGHPEAITAALEERFAAEKSPHGLTLLFSAGQGDKGSRGINRLGSPGLLERVIGGYWALAPRLCELAQSGAVEAYNWPQGIISQLFRAIAAGSPGVVSRVGLNTFIDPRQQGGRLNSSCREQLVKLIHLDEEEFLLYPSMPIQCAVIRGTRADAKGNISMEREANFQDALAQALAAHNSGGIVIAQVERISSEPIHAHLVRVPGIVVDYVVVAPPELHWQTYGEPFNPAFIGDQGEGNPIRLPVAPMGPKKIIARRAYLELMDMEAGAVVNLGIGIPETIASVANEERSYGFTLTVESGAIGGYPAGGMSFGATVAPEAVIEQPSLFDLYDGGGIDIAFLGNAQTDSSGNVNVSSFGGRLCGVGGFVNISQAAKRVVFCGTFTTGGLIVEVREGKLHIANEGKIAKFVNQVEQLSFNASFDRRQPEEVLYVTERCVLRHIDGALTVVEVAPGIDPVKDVVEKADADIRIATDLKEMDSRIFNGGAMSLRREPHRFVHYFPPTVTLQ